MTADSNSQEWINVLLERVDTLEKQVHELRHQVEELQNNDVPDHWHNEFATVDHVERSEYQFKNDIANLGYRLDSVERTANEAKRMARNAGGSRY